MARIRTIKPEFFTSEQIAECSPNARLLFIGMWCFCDDQGVHPASVKRLKMEVFPGDDFTTSDVSSMMQELISRGLVGVFEAEGERYWAVTGWKHQKIDRPNAKYPASPFAEQSTNTRRTNDEQSASDHPRKGKGKGREKEGNGREEEKEGKGETSNQRFTKPTADELRVYFDEIGLTEDPQRFLDFYESKAWKIGTSPMKDWKAAARTWLQRRKSEQPEPPKPTPNGRFKNVADMTPEEREMIQR